jgi:ATP-dependent helicase/nuclease subunit A
MTMSARIRFISAGAGSGKTTALAELLRQELAAGRVYPGGVLATTFTNRAATELRERVRAHLIREGAYELATAMGSARIGTVNSVCGSLLQRFAFEAGLSTEQRVLDEPRAAQLLREALDTVVEGPALSELLRVARRLSLLEPVRSGDPVPWRKALKALVDQARSNAIDADELRGFGARNADGMLANFPGALAEDLDQRLLDAIQGALPALRPAAGEGGKKNTKAYVELAEGAAKDLAAGNLTWAAWNKLAGAEPEKGLVPLIAPIVDAASLLPRHPKLHEDLRRYLVLMFELAAGALDAYEQAKRQIGALDFTDQERLLLDLLDDPGVATTLSDELDLLMVDEFQDTSPIQLALFLKLAARATEVVWVGDIKQAIYGFRGSDTRLMRAVIEALPSIGGTKEVLPYSWRSRPALVEFVNEVFGDAFAGIDRSDVTLKPKRPEFEGAVAVADWSLAGKNKGEIHLALAAGIARLVADRVQVVDRDSRQLRDIRLSDIAVLARANDTVVDIAATLRGAGVPSATQQPGLLGQPEAVLALACLRRLNDDRDTLATAEVVSLADCAEPEAWLADRLAWLAEGGDPAKWKEAVDDEGAGHPIIGTIQALRSQAVVLSPREAMELVIERCGIVRRVIQWNQDADRARVRLANLDRLIALASQYEDECLGSRTAATLSGLLLWLQDLAAEGDDALAQPAVDAVQVMTHHGAKGLEWNVVVLCDLAGDVKDRLWDIQAESLDAFEVTRPLHRRFLRYWPWPFGAQKKVAVADEIAHSPVGLAAHADAVEEHKRLLYVSMTRARDSLVFARPAKNAVGEWMETVSLDGRLPAEATTSIQAGDGGQPVPFSRWALDGSAVAAPSSVPAGDLVWWTHPNVPAARPPLRVSPSSLEGVRATVIETVRLGMRIDTGSADDRSQLGQAIHACIAAGVATPGQVLGVDEVQQILVRMGAGATLEPAALHRQVGAIRDWLVSRWPGAAPLVELPMTRRMANGQIVNGRSDLVLRTETGWILLDHKSTPQGSSQWEDVANAHAGQLMAYGEVLEAASGLPVLETWLVLPVAGAALRVGFAEAGELIE